MSYNKVSSLKYIMLSVPFESPDELPLFQNSHAIHSNPCLDRGVQIINNMIELDYLEYNPVSGFNFTTSGIKYMMNMYEKYHNTSFSSNSNEFEQLNKFNHDNSLQGPMNERFSKSNLTIGYDGNSCPDYNNNAKYTHHIKVTRGDKIIPLTDDVTDDVIGI
mgnify:CR=1 FL=1